MTDRLLRQTVISPRSLCARKRDARTHPDAAALAQRAPAPTLIVAQY